jgi:hypothetical protein
LGINRRLSQPSDSGFFARETLSYFLEFAFKNL